MHAQFRWLLLAMQQCTLAHLLVVHMLAGGLFAAPQQYMQQRVSWLKTNMTGGTMSALFNVNQGYGVSFYMRIIQPFIK